MIRVVLLKIRRLDVKLNDKQKLFLLLLAVLIWGFGIFMDMFVPFNIMFNTIRAGLCVIASLIVFGELYLYSIHNMERKMENDERYIPVRKRFTYKERKNMSIFMWVCLFIAMLMSSHPSYGYTFVNSWILIAAYSILTFVRANRDEYMKSRYKIPDKRDIDFDQKVKENIRKRREKWAKQNTKTKDDNTKNTGE